VRLQGKCGDKEVYALSSRLAQKGTVKKKLGCWPGGVRGLGLFEAGCPCTFRRRKDPPMLLDGTEKSSHSCKGVVGGKERLR